MGKPSCTRELGLLRGHIMAFKSLEALPQSLLQQCFSIARLPRLARPMSLRNRLPYTYTRLISSKSKASNPACSAPRITVQEWPSKSALVRNAQQRPIRTFSSTASRAATAQADSNITASYIASAGKVELVNVKKVLVIGSGGLSIGQAGEFDYSGTP